MPITLSDLSEKIFTSGKSEGLRRVRPLQVVAPEDGRNICDRLANDSKYDHFVKIPDRIVRCLDYFQAPVDRVAAARVLRAYYLFIGVVDHAIDSGDTNTATIVFANLADPAPIDESSGSDVAIITRELKRCWSRDNRGAVVSGLRELYASAVEERSANSIDSYIAKRKDVGRLTADVSYLLIRPLLDKEHHSLRRFMQAVGAVGCLLDSVIDLDTDQKRGLLSFRANLYSRLKLLFVTTVSGLSITLKHPQLAGLFFQAIADNVRDRFRMNSEPQKE